MVSGWDDPRFPTIRGILRRGLTVDALREFIIAQGASKAMTLMDVDKLWAINKKIIDPIVPRHTAIVTEKMATVLLADGPTTVVHKSVPRHKKNPELGNKVVAYSNKIFIEGDDAKDLVEKEEVTLMDWGNVVIDSVAADPQGRKTFKAHLHLEGSVKDTKKKLTWLADVPDVASVKIIEYDNLITKKKLDPEDNFDDFINPNSKFVVRKKRNELLELLF
jgi:glutamyl-tRNA synthetase